jgi:hypothetical protein
MQEIAFFDLTIVQRFRDYVSFSLRYTYGDHICSAVGMGWISEDKVFYYLNHVVLNDQYVMPAKLAAIGISDADMQLVFEHPELDALTKSRIKDFYKKT